MIILDGKQTGNDIKAELAARVDLLVKDGKRPPHLAAVLVGNDGASLTYVGSKVRSCERIGYESTLIQLPKETTEAELLHQIDRLNANTAIDGFIVQLPLPKHIDEEKVLMAIDPHKDVDGFHPTNFGKMALDMEGFIPATPYGIMELLRRYQVDISGKHAVVIGRSHIVGRPMSILLSRKSSPGNATVTLTHSRTKNLAAITKEADIVVSALGVPNFLKEDMVKEGAIIIDVGITRVPDASHPKGYVITGDVDYERVKDKASFITPVPGGVGPMTIAMLLQNTYLAYSRHADV
ncbi:MAG: bifunctional methylenetetrahydrofolate dehydrogenase/methenyltetrahydrofolate cyclohydrolase FolD [Flavobacteriaceae bacterium]|nr:bifunctional methylenetetrahydrofolate dehydrogenase/methenyltetrahydrofolate cyclohydrolase FolD [Flavobacteriaceae bacterium]